LHDSEKATESSHSDISIQLLKTLEKSSRYGIKYTHVTNAIQQVVTLGSKRHMQMGKQRPLRGQCFLPHHMFCQDTCHLPKHRRKGNHESWEQGSGRCGDSRGGLVVAGGRGQMEGVQSRAIPPSSPHDHPFLLSPAPYHTGRTHFPAGSKQ
jgi:hypothetical protein